jgi:hypothetical protein
MNMLAAARVTSFADLYDGGDATR